MGIMLCLHQPARVEVGTTAVLTSSICAFQTWFRLNKNGQQASRQLPALRPKYSIVGLVFRGVVERPRLDGKLFVVVNTVSIDINFDDNLVLLAIVYVVGLEAETVLVAQERVN